MKVPFELKLVLPSLPSPDTYKYELRRDGTVVWAVEVDEYDPPKTRRREHRRIIQPVAWAEFLAEFNQLRVPEWRSSYDTAGEVYDGYKWDLEYRDGRKTISSGGFNAGPRIGSPHQIVDPYHPNPRRQLPESQMASLALQEALDRLWQRSRTWWQRWLSPKDE